MTTLLPAARQRSLPLHVGCGPWQQGEVVDAIRRAQAAAEAECGRKLRVLRTDNGGEFTTAKFALYCVDEGVQRHYSAPYNPQQNGVVERHNQTVVGMARALLKQRGMSAVFWGETMVSATPPGTSTPAPAHVEPSPMKFATLLSHDEERIDACYDGETLRYRTMEDILGD
jgi:transposase InsO family protein